MEWERCFDDGAAREFRVSEGGEAEASQDLIVGWKGGGQMWMSEDSKVECREQSEMRDRRSKA